MFIINIEYPEDFDDLQTFDQMNSADTLPDSPPFNQLVGQTGQHIEEFI